VCRVQLVAIRSTADRNGYILEHENIHKEADNDALRSLVNLLVLRISSRFASLEVAKGADCSIRERLDEKEIASAEKGSIIRYSFFPRFGLILN
jgi:hypothetical protein